MNTQPEYLHLILNHLPLFGLLAALVPLVVGLVWKSRASLNAGLLLVVIAAAAAFGVMWTGEAAYERFEHDAALSATLDGPGNGWMHEHEERAEIAVWVVYGTGVVGLFALGLSVRRGGWGRKLAMLTTLGCAASIAGLGWVADAGGPIRHPELRPGFSDQNPVGEPPPHASPSYGDDEAHGP